MKPLELHPSLEEVVKAGELDRTDLTVAWKPREKSSDLGRP